ncbi:MAG: cytochrome P450 [Cyanobacteria bacterium P01_C01_bin.120]
MKTIPAPPTNPYLQLVNWIFRPLDYMEVNYRKYGDLFFARWGLLDWILVSHPQAIKTMFNKDTSSVMSAPGDANAVLKPLLGENSIIMLNGQQHRARRKLIMPPFHGERLKVYADLIYQITLEAMASLQQGQGLRARELTQKITMRVILQAVFGLHEGDRYRRLEYLLAERLDMVSRPLASTVVFFPRLQKDYGGWSPGAKLARLSQEIDDLLYAEIRDRRAAVDASRSDILSLLIMTRDEAGEGLSDVELRDELMTLLVAGHETTATAIAWALYWVHHQPDILAKIRDEIAAAHASNEPMALTKLPYLEATCNETLRIYPVAMLTFPRLVHEPLELLGHPIAPGTLLAGSIYLLHHREDLYPQSHEFRPERFLERQYAAYEFMPFGGGARRCIGYALAMYELKIILGTLLSNFEFALASDRPAIPERRGVTLGMKGGGEMVFHGQRSAAVPAIA